MCKGQCPGTALDRDWRNKSEHCGVWKTMYARLEDEMVAAGQLPLSLDPARQAIEAAMLGAWRAGTNASIGQLRERLDRQAAVGGPWHVRPSAAETGDRVLPPFVRLAWVSESARASWQPRLTALAAAVSTVEWLSVAEGARACAIVEVAGTQRAATQAAWAKRGLAALELARGRPSPPALRHGAVFAVGRSETVEAAQAIWAAGDDEGLGAALGYPQCCVSAVCRGPAGRRDGAWLMAAPAADGRPAPPAAGPAALNPLWWELGLAAIPHWACHPGCQESVAIAATFSALADDAGLGDDWRCLHEVLSWPAEWTARHGIAELKTPVLKMATATTVSHELWRAAWAGTSYPDEGATGVRFPYRAPRHLPLTSTNSASSAAVEPTPVFILNEFMTDEEIAGLRDYAEQHPGDFHPAKVGGSAGGRVDHSRRRAQVMYPGPLARQIRERVTAILPRAQEALSLPGSPGRAYRRADHCHPGRRFLQPAHRQLERSDRCAKDQLRPVRAPQPASLHRR